MSGRLVVVLTGLVLGLLAGYLYATLTKKVVPKIRDEKAAGPTRVVSAGWPWDRLSPGHSLHALDLALECDDCHDPSLPTFAGVKDQTCESCHLEQFTYAHRNPDGERTACSVCHAFKSSSDANPWDCVRCHGPFDALTHTGLMMHDDIACAQCHHPHEPFDETKTDCASCHESIRLHHGDPALSGTCVNCHGGHDLALEASVCMSCHDEGPDRIPQSAVFAGGHTECVDCHRPHSFTAAAAVSCESCHRGQHVLARTQGAHERCETCHDPHAVESTGDRTCQNCHADVESTHPPGDHGDCTACHDPHPARAAQLAAQCSSCHVDAGTDHGFHAPKAVCTDCHVPHAFDLTNIPEQTLCVECHTLQARLTRRIPAHEECSSCHEGPAHHLGNPDRCASCHGDLLVATPEGHRECASCHEPHGGSVVEMPTCTSCHETLGLPGLHQVPPELDNPGHSDCATCHNPHNSTVRADRDSCTECHTDMVDHQPDAFLCTGCHTFIAGKSGSRSVPMRVQ